MSSLGRLLVRSRPRFWLYLAGPVLVGAAFGATELVDLRSPFVLALLAYALWPANLFLYGVNDVFDAEIDEDNPKKAGREARWRGDRLTLVAVATSALLWVGLLAASPAAATPWLAGFLVLGWAYSAPPLRLKTRPPLDALSNVLYVLPGVAAYAALTGGPPPALALVGAWAWTAAMHAFSAIPDVGPDRAAGIRTTATVLGERRTLVACAAAWLVAAAAFGLLHPLAGVLMAVYPLAALSLAWGDVPVRRAYWWYPGLNAGVGAVLTVAGLWGLYA